METELKPTFKKLPTLSQDMLHSYNQVHKGDVRKVTQALKNPNRPMPVNAMQKLIRIGAVESEEVVLNRALRCADTASALNDIAQGLMAAGKVITREDQETLNGILEMMGKVDRYAIASTNAYQRAQLIKELHAKTLNEKVIDHE